MNLLLDTAAGYVAAGLSVIPVRADGSKAPALPGWRVYSKRLPTDDELLAWFPRGASAGVGVPCGPASGNLAVLDFESGPVWDRWRGMLPADLAPHLAECPMVRTPSGGVHIWVRLPDPVPGTVLARFRDKGVAIEVRGEGHQVLAPGCPASCHPSGRTYEFEERGWLDLPSLPAVPFDAWFGWVDLAASLTEYRQPDPPKATPRPERDWGDGDPGSDFNRRGTWEETGLLAAGWTWERQVESDRGFICRPGKNHGVSATVGMVSNAAKGWALFYPFTSNCSPFEQGRGYSRFGVFGLLTHNGDFKAAARALRAMGYGATDPKPASGATLHPTEPACSTDEQAGVKADEQTLPVVYFGDIGPALDAADFVEGLLIEGAMSVIYGESGSGKTFFTLDLALHIAGGLPWRGREVDRRGVLYLALEGAHGICNRVSAFRGANTNTPNDLPFAIVPVALDLLNPAADTERVIAAAKLAGERLGVPVGLIVVDTLSRAMAGGNENASEDMGALVLNIDRIRQALPAHVAVVHHCGKDAARGARGHSSLRAATDTEIEVSRDLTAGLSVARVMKQRDLELVGEFAFRLETVELGNNRRGKPVTSCVVREADPERVQADAAGQKVTKARETLRLKFCAEDAAVLDVIDCETERGNGGATLTKIRKGTGWGQERIKSVLARLEEDFAVEKCKVTKAKGNGAEFQGDGWKRLSIKQQKEI